MSTYATKSNDSHLPCVDKIAFDTKEQAEATAIVSEHRYGSELGVYRCQHCDLWHLATA